jgi:hypothetical protein
MKKITDEQLDSKLNKYMGDFDSSKFNYTKTPITGTVKMPNEMKPWMKAVAYSAAGILIIGVFVTMMIAMPWKKQQNVAPSSTANSTRTASTTSATAMTSSSLSSTATQTTQPAATFTPAPSITPNVIDDPGDLSAFHFRLSFGVQMKNVIDTFNGTFTKDLVIDPPYTAPFHLSEQHMLTILTEMERINVFAYPDIFEEESNMRITPFNTYKLEIEYKGISKTIYWEDENLSQSERTVKLRGLIKMIEGIVYYQDEYKAMPTPHGGYI